MKPRVGENYQNRYLILSELGAGGMGLVFHARQIDANREVALKILHTEQISDKDAIARFYREFRLLSKLSHPHILNLYGLALDEDSIPFAVCEYVDAKSLRQVLQDGALEWHRALSIALQISESLQYAHEQGVLHRDLKPDNVLVSQSPEKDFVKLIDFGLARAVEVISDSQKLTSSGMLLGSPHYMSPEQTAGKADSRSDIYSLGCMLFELLTNQKLFEADTGIGVIYLQINESPSRRLNSIKPPIPSEIAKILSKMLAKDPESRYQTMNEVSKALESVLLNPDNEQSFLEKHRNTLLAGTCIILAFLAFLQINRKAPVNSISQAEPRLLRKTSTAVSAPMLLKIANELRTEQKAPSADIIAAYKKAIKAAEDSGNLKWIADSHFNLANYYGGRGEYPQAAQEYRQTLDSEPEPETRLRANSCLAMIDSGTGKFEQASQRFESSINDYANISDIAVDPLLTAYEEYVKALIKHSMLKKAYEYEKKAIESSKSSKTPAVAITWLYFDTCRDLGKEAEGRKLLDNMRDKLCQRAEHHGATDMKKLIGFHPVDENNFPDATIVSAIARYADLAREEGFDKDAKEMYQIALKGSSRLLPKDAPRIQQICEKGLAELNKKSRN